MKKRIGILTAILLCSFLVTKAQQQTMSAAYDSSRRFDLYAEHKLNEALLSTPSDSLKKRIQKMYARWTGFWRDRYSYDVPAGGSIFDPFGMGLSGFFSPANHDKCLGSDASNWSYLGPKHNFYGQSEDKSGRVSALWVNPLDAQHILAGSASGGLFRTYDGGQNWVNITDNGTQVVPGTMGVSHIAVHPADETIIYLATGTVGSAVQWGNKYGMGLVYSIDNGATWINDAHFKAKLGQTWDYDWETNDYIERIGFSPYSHTLYVVYKNRVYARSDFSNIGINNPWSDITPSLMGSISGHYQFLDIEFEEGLQGKVIFSTNCVQNTQYLLRYNEVNQQWQNKAIVIPGFDNINNNPSPWNPPPYVYSPGNGIEDMSLSASNEVYMKMGLLISGTHTSRFLLYKYNWATDQLTSINQNMATYRIVNNQNEGVPFRIIVSKHNDQRVYVTDVRGYSQFIYKSENGGVTFASIGETHADGRCPILYTSTNSANGINDVIFCGTDGGVAKKSAGNASFVSITGNGLHIAEMYSLSTSPSNNGLLTAGAVDNGTQAYVKHDANNPWKFPRWGDGLMTSFARNGVLTSFSQSQEGFNSAMNFNLSNGSVGSTNTAQPQELHQSKWWKPVKFDTYNKARVGYWFIWRTGLADNETWTPAFGIMSSPNEPKPSVEIHDLTDANKEEKRGRKFVRDFIVSDFDGNIGYIAYGEVNWGELADARIEPMEGKLFVSQDLLNPIPTWRNVSPPYLRSYQITDIETDPRQPNRIWVAYGGVQWDKVGTHPSTREARVMYNFNYGEGGDAAWHPFSKGLPPMPILKLLYVEGSDDVMFAATDVGVYRWNKALQQWECFNNGMPRCMVTDMEINYCSGKLRVTTMGRGIWESDYRTDIDSYVPGDGADFIPSNTVWSASKTVSASVRVKAGYTLTISGSNTTIYMPRNARILVEPGAKLIVDGATITNECGGEWGGIELAGNRNAVPDPANQGYCQLINGAKIINAKRGIRNFTWDNGAQGGGIIKAENSAFINCKRSVELNDYPNYSYFYNGGSQCSFNNVDFIYNDEIPGGAPGSMFTSWNTYTGVMVNNCHFTNQMSSPALIDRGKAIAGIHTGINIENSTFSGFSQAIRFEGLSRRASRVVSVFNNQFTSNGGSVMMAAASYGDIKGNAVYNLPNKGSYGFYLDRAYGSYVGCQNVVNGNYFGGFNNNGGYGLIANGTLNYTTHVVNNEFRNLTIGVQTQLTNSQLYVLCNTFRDSRFGFFINPQTLTSAFRDQGTMAQPAGNKFININTSGIASYTNVPWTYYSGPGANETPTYFGTALTLASSPNANRCAKPFFCYFRYERAEFDNIRNAYGTLVTAGQKNSEEGRMLFADLVRAYNHLDDKAGLQAFLESENDDEARKSLLSLYIETHQYAKVPVTLAAMSLPTADATAYNNYYTLLSNLEQNDRRLDSLDSNERIIVETIANNDSLELSSYAKAWMEYAFGVIWEHPIEEIPLTAVNKQVKLPPSSDALESKLFDAAPNPASKTATLHAFVNQMDFDKKTYFQIRDIHGKELYRSEALGKGDNTIDVNIAKFPSGIYLYSLISDTRAIDTKKLSVQR